MQIKLPHPGASEIENLVATLLLDGNLPENLNLELIAKGRRYTADEIAEEFKMQLNGDAKLPEEVAASAPPAIQTTEEEE